MATFQRVVLAKRPKADIVPGETFKLERAAAPTESSLEDGEVLFETRYLSIDPAMRGWLNDTRSYIPPVKIGEVMRGQTIGVVKASKAPEFPVGSLAVGTTGWSELAVAKAKHLQKVELPKDGKLTDALSVLGKPSPTHDRALLTLQGPLVLLHTLASSKSGKSKLGTLLSCQEQLERQALSLVRSRS